MKRATTGDRDGRVVGPPGSIAPTYRRGCRVVAARSRWPAWAASPPCHSSTDTAARRVLVPRQATFASSAACLRSGVVGQVRRGGLGAFCDRRVLATVSTRSPNRSRSVCSLVRTTTVLSRCDRGADENGAGSRLSTVR
jgi:hypothetical protein